MALRFVTANMLYSTGPIKDREHLLILCASADVLLLQECKNIDVAELLPEGWVALQDTSSEAKAGTAICYREEAVRARGFRLRLGTLPRLGYRRAKMLARYIASAVLIDQATGERYYAVAAHLPPKRYAYLQPAMIRKLRRMARFHPRMVLGIDGNMPVAELAERLGMKVRGTGIDGLFYGPKITPVGRKAVSREGIRKKLTDHPTVRNVFRSRR